MTASPTGIVRWTMAAFHANPDASDDEITDLLVEAGLPHASRAVTMLPIAFGRRILDGLITPSTTYRRAGDETDRAIADDETDHAFADDPIYVAAERIAREEATSADLETIGTRSAEVNAVNSALNAGMKEEDLRHAAMATVVTIHEREVPAQPEARAIIDELLRAHRSSLSVEVRQFPRRVAPKSAQLQVDYVVRVDDRELVESFAGLGGTIHDAIGDTVKKLTSGTLHVLMAVLDRRELGAEQVVWETWGSFDVCLGGMLRLWSDAAPRDLGAFLDALKTLLLAAELPRATHWVRVFVGTDGREILGLDVLVDNAPFPAGETLAREWAWPVTERAYGIRLFFMLVPRE